jgi:hypothetical protein
LFLLTGSLLAQQPDSVQFKPQKPVHQQRAKQPQPKKVYYGGEVGFSFGSFFRVRVAPMVGYRFTPKASLGFKVAYEYIKDKRYSETLTSHNYGGSVFARFRPQPRVYLHAEYCYASYEYRTPLSTSEREWVPFLFLGAGFVQPLGNGSSVYAQVLFDVLQNSNSPYDNWEPFFTVGIGVGL